MAKAKYLYYSAQTQLAYRICKKYFKGRFVVHSCDEFNPHVTNPNSSNPASLYNHYRRVVETDDRGDVKIERVKEGLKNAGLKKFRKKQLTKPQYDALVLEVSRAQTREFMPLLYIIQKAMLRDNQFEDIPPDKRANPDSEEFILKNLTEKQFDILEAKIEVMGA